MGVHEAVRGPGERHVRETRVDHLRHAHCSRRKKNKPLSTRFYSYACKTASTNVDYDVTISNQCSTEERTVAILHRSFFRHFSPKHALLEKCIVAFDKPGTTNSNFKQSEVCDVQICSFVPQLQLCSLSSDCFKQRAESGKR